MTGILTKALIVTKKQWQLLLFTVAVTVLFQMDYGLGNENFGFVILIAIPYLFWMIFTFCLPKLIHFKTEHNNATLVELLKLYSTYIPKLFFQIIGLMFLVIALMFILITMVYGFFRVFGIENSRSIFESGPTDLNYLLFQLFLNIVMAFFSFQNVLYFFRKYTFFYALKGSINVAKRHLPFTIMIGVAYYLTTVSFAFIGAVSWYQNLLVGILSGLQIYFFAVVILLFFEKKVKE